MPLKGLDAFWADNDEQLGEVVSRFSDYEPLQGLDRPHLRKWLAIFQPQHRQLALKLAQSISYYSTHKLNGLMPNLHEVILQQRNVEGAAHSDVFYVPFGRTGESGSDIIRRYRNANRLSNWGSQFITSTELPEKLYGLEKPVVFFLDDFVGTGNQVSEAWQETIGQVVPDYIPLYLAVVAAMGEGIARIENETPLKVLCVHTLGPRWQLTESACQSFSSSEKSAIKVYCRKAGNLPLGFQEAALLLSFAYGTPNNTISVIRGSKKQRPCPGLLPRWEDMP